MFLSSICFSACPVKSHALGIKFLKFIVDKFLAVCTNKNTKTVYKILLTQKEVMFVNTLDPNIIIVFYT